MISLARPVVEITLSFFRPTNKIRIHIRNFLPNAFCFGWGYLSKAKCVFIASFFPIRFSSVPSKTSFHVVDIFFCSYFVFSSLSFSRFLRLSQSPLRVKYGLAKPPARFIHIQMPRSGEKHFDILCVKVYRMK